MTRLVLRRRRGESLLIGGTEVMVTAAEPGTCQLSIDAPRGMTVMRRELVDDGTRTMPDVPKRFIVRRANADVGFGTVWPDGYTVIRWSEGRTSVGVGPGLVLPAGDVWIDID